MKNDLPLADVLSRVAHVGASGRYPLNDDPLAVRLSVLEANNRVGPRGSRRAGHDAQGFARRHLAGPHLARRKFADDAQTRMPIRRALQIADSYGIAVHGGVVVGWHVRFSADVLGQHPAQSFED